MQGSAAVDHAYRLGGWQFLPVSTSQNGALAYTTGAVVAANTNVRANSVAFISASQKIAMGEK